MRRECRERFPPPPRASDSNMHHGTCLTHVPWCMPGSLTSSFIWSRWRGKRSRHSRRMRNPQFYVSGKRPMVGENYVVCAWTELEVVMPPWVRAVTTKLSLGQSCHFNSSAPGRHGRHFTDNIFIHVFVNEKFCILIWISLKFVPKGPIENNPALV